MIIHKGKKAVLLRLRQPTRVTTVIPTAKIVPHKKGDIVAVPHRPDETRVLRNLGFDVPDPMPMHYGWPGRFTPFDAQLQTASFLSMQSRAFCLNSMGLGKTLTALWAYDYLRSIKQVKKALVICPLSTMEHTWADEVFRTFPHLDFTVLYGTREKRLKLLNQDSDLYIINTDGIRIIEAELKERPDIDLVIVDEMAMYRNSQTERWKSLNSICNKQAPRRVWALTGSPTPNLPTDAWAQCRILTPENPALPRYFNKFRDLVMRQVTQFKWVPREEALDIVRNVMQPAIRFSLDDCTDLPPQIFITRDAQMTDEQKKAYKDMMSKLQAEYSGGQITAVNEAVKANKLLQIVCGVAYSDSKDSIIIPSAPRVEVLKELIEESEGKVIVFAPLTGVLEQLYKDISVDWTTALIHGGTPKHERDQIFRAFQNTDDPRVLIANPGTMSHGLTLTKATTIVWFGPTNSNETYEQACARVRRPGQTKTTVIAHIAASEIERRVYDRLRNKQQMQGVLLDMIKENDHAHV